MDVIVDIYGGSAFDPNTINLYFPNISSVPDTWESDWNAFNCPVYWNTQMPE